LATACVSDILGIEVGFDLIKRAYVQALLSLSDRRVAWTVVLVMLKRAWQVRNLTASRVILGSLRVIFEVISMPNAMAFPTATGTDLMFRFPAICA